MIFEIKALAYDTNIHPDVIELRITIFRPNEELITENKIINIKDLAVQSLFDIMFGYIINDLRKMLTKQSNTNCKFCGGWTVEAHKYCPHCGKPKMEESKL